jgi:hypothetical protein
MYSLIVSTGHTLLFKCSGEPWQDIHYWTHRHTRTALLLLLLSRLQFYSDCSDVALHHVVTVPVAILLATLAGGHEVPTAIQGSSQILRIVHISPNKKIYFFLIL